MSEHLKTAAAKAAPRRFTGERITAMGPLLPTDSLVERIETIWGLPSRLSDDPEVCGSCNGSGQGQYDGWTCSSCNGKGVLPRAFDPDEGQPYSWADAPTTGFL